MCLFLPPNLLYTLDFRGRLSLLFAVNFCCLGRGSSPWIFISPLTPLNVNSSFPVLLFISVAWWFDHAGNTRLAIALSLVFPQGHLLQKCYCLCFLTLCVLNSFKPFIYFIFWGGGLFLLTHQKSIYLSQLNLKTERELIKPSHFAFPSTAIFLVICLCIHVFNQTCHLIGHIINLR